MTITLFAISTDTLSSLTRLTFERDDQPLTEAGYDAVFRDLRAGGTTARFVSVGASDGSGRIVDVIGLLGPDWEATAANVRWALAHGR